VTSSSSLLPATCRALTHRIAVGQAEGRTPSLVGAVARDGGQAWCGARSMLEGHEPDAGTQYRIGSLTKTFIAVLVMRLRDECRLDLADRAVELGPATGRGRASRFRAEPDGTWTGLDGYYTGETLRLVRGADGTADHLDLGSFVFTRTPYAPDAPLAARPDPEGWRPL
jgi:CubicO group peptidase (beta-lactamase class C family)